MFKSIKNGVVVTSVLDSRTINKEGTYPIKIKVYYQRKPKYYSVGICMSKDEWDKLPDSRSSEGRFIQGEIEKEFSRILKNVEFLVENGTFSFDRLNARLGKTQLYTFEQASIIHNTCYNKVYCCVFSFLFSNSSPYKCRCPLNSFNYPVSIYPKDTEKFSG